MKLEIGREVFNSYEKATSREWLETNGLGGYASSTLSGANTRSYHGLFVVAAKPPLAREVLLSKLEEVVHFDDKAFYLQCNQFPNFIFSTPATYIQRYVQDPFPEFHYKVKNIHIKKTICFVHNSNTLAITYEVLKSDREFIMELKPFSAFRDIHTVGKENNGISPNALFHHHTLTIQPYKNHPAINIFVQNSSFRFAPAWAHKFEYPREFSRGLDYSEDLFQHGQFILSLKEGEKISIIVSTEPIENPDAFTLITKERKRREQLYAFLPVQDDILKILALAADQFLVKRGELKTIIAGYHWFSDWGRDTMISLPGICLATGRYEEAKKIIQAFALSLDKGMIPNRFPDEGEVPEYNTVDATLWYYIAIWKYFEYTQDKNFILHQMLPVLEEIFLWHKKGTRYNIHVEADGLIFAGEPGVQLTWMDAKVGDWVVTPRIGKPVEINALWYNAVCILREIYQLADNTAKAEEFALYADKIKNAFVKEFINKEKGYLYDYVNGSEKNSETRPNQIFAISLPFDIVDNKTAKSILKVVEDKLLVPFGLRSLSPTNPKYVPHYDGDQFTRDGAYHQGTVWSWLLGPYISAKIKIEGEHGKNLAIDFLKGFEKHFLDAGIGNISEIFDGEEPHTPNGCIAQAWGVAELLRVYCEDIYNVKIKFQEKDKKSSKKLIDG